MTFIINFTLHVIKINYIAWWWLLVTMDSIVDSQIQMLRVNGKSLSGLLVVRYYPNI